MDLSNRFRFLQDLLPDARDRVLKNLELCFGLTSSDGLTEAQIKRIEQELKACLCLEGCDIGNLRELRPRAGTVWTAVLTALSRLS